MEKQQKNQIKKYISWGLVAALVALLAFMPLMAAGEENADGPQASVLSGTVERKTITTSIIGGGTLTTEDAVEISIPAAVKLTGYMVGNGDTVAEGDVLASVDRVSVMTAITQVQETLDCLAEKIEAISNETASGSVVAQASGTVKILYAEEGQKVQDVMLEHGALAVLSLDDLMAVQVERSTALSAGDSVCVTLSDGTEVQGMVESNLGGVLTVTIADDGYAIGEKVSLTSDDGDRIGSGTLYIHNPWKAVASSGIISDIRVGVGSSVSAGSTLVTLEDTGHTAQYYQLSDQHREYEELMFLLFEMYQSQTLTAPCAGVVSGVDENGTYMLADEGSGWKLTLLSNAPDGSEETAYVNYVGQVTSVGIDGLVLKMNPQQLNMTDYKDLSAIVLDASSMTEDVIYTAQAPVYELVEGEWLQIDASGIAAGDILLFAGDADGNFVWVIRVAESSVEPEEPEDTEPTDPIAPSEPADPETPADPGSPDGSAYPSDQTQGGSGFPQGSGALSGFGGGTVQQEEKYEMYSLETVTVASVTPQENMTVEITIDELDITKITVGQSATVTVDALSGEQFAGTITQIANSGETEGGNSKFTVELTLEKRGDMLPGMNASVFITQETVSDVLSVPVAALTEEGMQTILYTGYDEETGVFTNPVTVCVGISDGENAEILSGIEEGTTYYYPYYDTLVISDTPQRGGFLFGR